MTSGGAAGAVSISAPIIHLSFDRLARLSDDASWQTRRDAIQHLVAISRSHPRQIVSGLTMPCAAFTILCQLCIDIDRHVRVAAFNAIAAISIDVSKQFLLQTFSKVHLADIIHTPDRININKSQRRMQFDHSELEDLVDDGGDLVTARLFPEHATGAFVYGLEDEYGDVRVACVVAIRTIGCQYRLFAAKALDFLVDMFNDELVGVRLAAIEAVRRISSSHGDLSLTPVQLRTTLSLLVDRDDRSRLAIIPYLGALPHTSTPPLCDTILALLRCLTTFPNDREHCNDALREIGLRHVALLPDLVAQWVATDPFFLDYTQGIAEPTYNAFLIFAQAGAPSLFPRLRAASVAAPAAAASNPRIAPCVNAILANVRLGDFHAALPLTIDLQRLVLAPLASLYSKWIAHVCSFIVAYPSAQSVADLAHLTALSHQLLIRFRDLPDHERFHLHHCRVVTELLTNRAPVVSLRECYNRIDDPPFEFPLPAVLSFFNTMRIHHHVALIPQWYPQPNLQARFITAIISEPTGDPEKVIKGRVHCPIEINIVAQIDIECTGAISVNLCFADGSCYQFMPPNSHFHALVTHTHLDTRVRIPHDLLRRRKDGVQRLQVGLVWRDDVIAPINPGDDLIGAPVNVYVHIT